MKAYLISDERFATSSLANELDRLGVATEMWTLRDRSLALDDPPPDGVFVNRASPSGALERGERERLRDLMAWLEGHKKRVINGSGVVALESGRVLQHTALRAAGIAVPRTVAAAAEAGAVRRAAAEVGGGGAVVVTSARPGTAAVRFEDARALERGLLRGDVVLDGGTALVREALGPAEVTRLEFIGGTLRRVWRWQAEEGAGEVGTPVAAEEVDAAEVPDDPLIDRYLVFLHTHGFGVGAVEFVTTGDGRRLTLGVSGGAEPWRAWGGLESAVAALVAFEARRVGGGLQRAVQRLVRAAV